MNPINPMKLLQIKNAWDQFQANHPKFPKFLSAVHQHGIQEGTIIEVKITTPEGEELTSNLKVKAEDIALFQEMKELYP